MLGWAYYRRIIAISATRFRLVLGLHGQGATIWTREWRIAFAFVGSDAFSILGRGAVVGTDDLRARGTGKPNVAGAGCLVVDTNPAIIAIFQGGFAVGELGLVFLGDGVEFGVFLYFEGREDGFEGADSESLC